MIEAVKRAVDDALARVADANTADEVRALEAELLGKRGPFAMFKTGLGALATVDDKRAAGQAVNEATTAVVQRLESRRRELASAERQVQLAAERLDLTEVMTRPQRGHAHVVTQAWERLEDVFIGLGFQVAEGPEVETDWYNFEALNMPPDHPARSMHDTFYLEGDKGTTVLRTHTSPVQIRVMQTLPPPIYMIMPGRVFRNETTDATHLAVFHQLEGLVIDRGITLADLAGTIDAFTKAFFGAEFGSRLRPSYFPFTEPSAEFDIQTPSGQWLELGGSGMVHPNVLRAGGLDPEEWSGFAFGFGIDRMAKERHAIGDVREMYSNDLRFVEQF
ncbi:MAG TPA: phenylalanine--tRNA ligase subunit alpha [Ilumatobacteraceae bacterium]|nr:phenylalanine--tRNA ligase subunit alpha [Ilumatobacteraceae bacterium]